MAGRLVEQKQLWLLCQQRCERDAPPLASRKRAYVARLGARHIGSGKRLARDPQIVCAFPLPARKMRMAADEHGFEHGCGERVAVVLQEQAAQARNVAARECSQGLSTKLDRACRRIAQSGEGVQQRRLARAVATQDRPALSGQHCKIEAAAHSVTGNGHAKAVRGEQRRHRCSRRSR